MALRTEPPRRRWRRRTRWPLAAALLTAAGCATRPAGPVAVGAQADDREILALVRQSLQADASGQPANDLYLPNSTVIANGADRRTPPRFAGVGAGGRVRVTAVNGYVEAGFAWATADYQWVAGDGNASEAAKATFLMERLDGRWRIRHVHSSLVLPWQTGP